MGRRLGRVLKNAEEPLLQWRRKMDCPTIISLRKAIVTPLSFQQGRELPAGHITILTNPTFILITPGTEADGQPIDIAQGDLFVRLKYHTTPGYDKKDNTPYDQLSEEKQKVLEQVGFDAIHNIITVDSFETQIRTLRILGELQ